ncbi:MAG: hypothetical protein SFV15_12780 [Polyangiaceae bacterium]|nr:hypothetical protein [Polyangiaceae bacterium]
MAPLFSRGLLASSLLAMGVVSFATSCSDQETSLYIQGVLAPTPPTCIYKPDATSTLLGRGVVDRAFGDIPYTAALLVGNQLVSRSDPERLRVETSRVALEGAIVKVSSSTGAVLAEYTTPGTGFVDPGNGKEAGRGVFFATLLPGNVGTPGELYIVRVAVFGKTIGGVEVQSSELLFTVEVCDGCLVKYPAAADDPAANGYTCTAAPDAMVESPCQIGVDEGVDCRVCAGSLAICKQPPGAP